MLDAECLLTRTLESLHIRPAVKVRVPAAEELGQHTAVDDAAGRGHLLLADGIVAAERRGDGLWTAMQRQTLARQRATHRCSFIATRISSVRKASTPVQMRPARPSRYSAS